MSEPWIPDAIWREALEAMVGFHSSRPTPTGDTVVGEVVSVKEEPL